MKNDNWGLALRVMARLSGWIAVPVIIALFLGKWLDRKFSTAPWLLLTTIGVAFSVSMVGLIINALKEFKRIEKEYSNKDAKQSAVKASGGQDTITSDKK